MKNAFSVKRRNLPPSLCLGAFTLLLGLAGSAAAAPNPTASAYGKLPLSFAPNRGQAAPEVRFLSRGQGYQLFLTAEEAVLTLQKPASEKRAVVRMRIEGATPKAAISGLEPLPGKVNYLRGKDPKQWRTDIPTYGKVKYAGIYPGIDLVYYGRDQQLEYDFVVAPGADPEVIALTFSGGEPRLAGSGELVLATATGEVRFHKPVLYQERQGRKQPVEGRYVRRGGGQIGFEVDAYDPTRPLVIDPVLSYSTYLGGKGSNWGAGIAVDRSGQAHVVGETLSDRFPTTAGSWQPVYNGNHDIFVAKLNAAGDALLYATYLGGSDHESMRGSGGIAVDRRGHAYVIGNTYSDDFPTTPQALQRVPGGGRSAFVAKLNTAGNGLVYATYLGGSRDEWGQAIAVDPHGQAYVTGYTESEDFPTTPQAVQPIHGNAGDTPDEFGQIPADAFVAKLNSTGSALVYSTYLGGSGFEGGNGVAVDFRGRAYIVGSTWSDDFPTQNPLPLDPQGGDAFVTKLNGTGSRLVYSTYLGGSSWESGEGIAIDTRGRAYITGTTFSKDFPTRRPLQARLRGDSDAFVAKLNASGNALVYATYFGGNSSETGSDIAVNSRRQASLVGQTWSEDIPLHNALQSAHGGGSTDAFVAQISRAGKTLMYASYLGGSRGDGANSIAVDSRRHVYIVGETTSDDFPLRNALQPVGGQVEGFVVDQDAFITKITRFPPHLRHPWRRW